MIFTYHSIGEDILLSGDWDKKEVMCVHVAPQLESEVLPTGRTQPDFSVGIYTSLQKSS